MKKRQLFKTVILSGVKAAIVFSMCVALSSCQKNDTETKEKEFSKYSLSEFEKDLSDEKIDTIDIYYLRYSIQFNRPLKKEDFIRGFYSYKISSRYNTYQQINDAFSSCPLTKADREIGESRLACDFRNTQTGKYLRIYFSYDLKRMQINGKNYDATEDFLRSIAIHLPQNSYQTVMDVLKEP